MIYFLTLLTSLCIQFAAVSFPIDANQVINADFDINSCIGSINSHFSSSLDPNLCFIVSRGSSAPYFYYPKEALDPNVNSSFLVTSRLDNRLDFTTSNYIRLTLNSDYSYKSGNLTSTYNPTVFYFGDSSDTPYLEYIGSNYTLPFDSVDTFYFQSVPELSGHTQSGKNDKILDPLPFPNVPTVTGHSSVSTVDDTSTNNLLGNILNTLQVIGNTITGTGNNIITFISDLYGNINDTINYVIEPLDPEEVIDIMKNSHYNGLFDDLKNVKDSFDNLSNSDHVILSFTLPAYLGGDTFSFDFAQYFNSSKHIWQPLLLTFLYASLVWGFYKGFANMVNGSSPFVSDSYYMFANDRMHAEQASDNHTR